jgi:hypothetical protein
MDQTNEEDLIWEILKYGVHVISSVVQFTGNGIARKFNSAWLLDAVVHRVTMNDVARSAYRDYDVRHNEIIFNAAPPAGAMIAVSVYS